MSQSSKLPRSNQRSIKYKYNLLERAPSGLANFVHRERAPACAKAFKHDRADSQPKSCELLSTAELILAAGHAWDYTSRSFAVLQQKTNLSYKASGSQKYNGLHDFDHDLWRFNHADISLMGATHLSKVDNLKMAERVSALKFYRESYSQSLAQSLSGVVADVSNGLWDGKGIPSLGISSGLGHIYSFMNAVIPSGRKEPSRVVEHDGGKAVKYIFGNVVAPLQDLRLGDTDPKIFDAGKSAKTYSPSVQLKDLTGVHDEKLVLNERGTSLSSVDYLKVADGTEAGGCISKGPCSSLHTDHHFKSVTSGIGEWEFCCDRTNDNEFSNETKENCDDIIIQEEAAAMMQSTAQDKPETAFAKQEHAFAGAFAGIFVSICLHPVDTIKTVIQSCRADQKSLCFIGKSIVSERGLSGLYRGISSNIASSAPISAVYTFTYESVKGALLPLFHKDYHSVAHCLAGGCASIATSFIFTPSERIKQQMQVGTHYHNCWNAVVEIIRKGGLPSLYTGWGAVLCRNIPHSVIKFYMYENLKNQTLSSLPPGAQLSTSETLVCGGLAASSAALFTTPFDVVKTRLQTQRPGSVGQYNSVSHALWQIGQREGLKGLYRGLTPRLVMYVSQGALFFASYEFFKRLFSLDKPQQLNARRQQYEGDMEVRVS